jgi:hypothetical protein
MKTEQKLTIQQWINLIKNPNLRSALTHNFEHKLSLIGNYERQRLREKKMYSIYDAVLNALNWNDIPYSPNMVKYASARPETRANHWDSVLYKSQDGEIPLLESSQTEIIALWI